MTELNPGSNPALPDAAFDLDGTVFKMNVLEAYTEWLAKESVFDHLPPEVVTAKRAWKDDNTEERYVAHIGKLVSFFVEQIAGKSVSQMNEAAHIVANQQKHRRWNITTSIIRELQSTHNILAISHMPEQLMEPFVRDLGYVALIGSTYVTQDGYYTGDAYRIDKATEYAKIRNGDTSKLDIHMGDTIGDSSLFALARRAILFNPSDTLIRANGDNTTIMLSHKDVVTVVNPGNTPGGKTATLWGPPFDITAILEEVQSKSP